MKHSFLFPALIALVLANSSFTFSQVEHNYLVGPQSTNCDSLDLSSDSLGELIKRIENSTFRFQQQFKISRTYGIMNARYFSCDGERGFLIMKIDKKDLIYFEVPKSVWDTLITSSDINAYYASQIRDHYEMVGGK